MDGTLKRDLLAAGVVYGPATLRSGQTSDWYLDKYRMQADPVLLVRLVAALAAELPPAVEVIAGVELGAVPLMAALAYACRLPFAIVRRTAKGYGTARAIEGADVRGRRVVLLEDVLTTGASAQMAADRLGAAGANSVRILAVFDRGEAVLGLWDAGYSATALYRVTDADVAARW